MIDDDMEDRRGESRSGRQTTAEVHADHDQLEQPGAEAALSAPTPNQVLVQLQDGVNDLTRFMQLFHRAIVCNRPPDRRVTDNDSHLRSPATSWMYDIQDGGLLDQQAFRDLARLHKNIHDRARLAGAAAAAGDRIPLGEYDQLISMVNRFYEAAERISDAFRKLSAEIDPLTGLNNRQVMLRDLDTEFERGKRSGQPLCIALADIDHFKSVNDTYGHGVGDQVLQSVAGRFQATLRPYDSIYRYGGEEFLICLPNTDTDAGGMILERLRQALLSEPVAVSRQIEGEGGAVSQEALTLPVTASFGLVLAEYGAPWKTSVEYADQALYAAKERGRNQATLWHGGGLPAISITQTA